MKTKVVNYFIVGKKDKETGNGKPGYTALCPTLGVADDGKTIDQALENVKGAMEAYIESLILDKLPIPSEDLNGETLLTKTSVNISLPAEFV